jgi:hypothetical protein
MIDRFSDGDPTNNDLPQSTWHLRSKQQVLLPRGDFQGVINTSALPKRSGRDSNLADSLV